MNDHSFRMRLPSELWDTIQKASEQLGSRSAAEYIRDSVEKALRVDGYLQSDEAQVTLTCPYCKRQIKVKTL